MNEQKLKAMMKKEHREHPWASDSVIKKIVRDHIRNMGR
jgi:hypothetical protein